MFDTAKIVLTWRCNMDCAYCCNKQRHIKESFKPIKQEKLIDLPHKDFEITGGELTMGDTFGRCVEILRNWLPKNRNYYLYTNGLWLNQRHAYILKRYNLTGINVGIHIGERCSITNTIVKSYNWQELYKVHKIIPIRLWVKNTDIKIIPNNLPFVMRVWEIGECDELRTDRYKLHFLS